MSRELKPQWFHILLALADGELHGLGIVDAVLTHSGGRVRLWPATLYGSLKELVSDGLIEERDGPPGPGSATDRRRFYGITRAGKKALAAEVGQLVRYVEVAQRKKVPVKQ